MLHHKGQLVPVNFVSLRINPELSTSQGDSDEDNVLAGNDEMEGTEDEAASRRFLSQMAKSEKGEAR